MKRKDYDENGWKILDLEENKRHLQFYLRGGLSKEKVKALVNKWVAYYPGDRDKIIQLLDTL